MNEKILVCNDIRKEIIVIDRLKSTLLSAKIIFMKNKNKYGIMLSLLENGKMLHKPIIYDKEDLAKQDLEKIVSVL